MMTSNEARWQLARNAWINKIKFSTCDEIWMEYISRFRNKVTSLTCDEIKDEDLDQIGCCPSLTSCSMNCALVDGASLRSFLEGNPQVRYLKISHCQDLHSLQSILTLPLCQHLQQLEICNNIWVTDEIIFEIIESCLSLKFIDFSHTSVANDETVEALVRTYPHIHSIVCHNTPLPSETSIFVLRQVTFRSLMSNDPKYQEIALDWIESSLEDNRIGSMILDELVSSKIFHRLAELLSSPGDTVSLIPPDVLLFLLGDSWIMPLCADGDRIYNFLLSTL
jgi:hypothetical protein